MKHIYLFITILLLIGCDNPKKQFAKEKSCVEIIMQADKTLGGTRNHDSKKISLSKTIDKYTASVEKLDFSNCPKNFSKAFQNHIMAWKEMKSVTNKYSTLRGEMHDLFDSIKKTKDSSEYQLKLDAIFSTWKEVELALEPYKVPEE